jgi:outer membrane biosynthesis protein TonB
MSDAPRRRRSEEEPSGGGGGLPLFPLILVVIFAGLLLGGALAKFFGGRPSSKATPPPATFTIAPERSAAPIAMATRAASPAPTPTTAPTAASKPSSKPSAKPSPAASLAPSTAPSALPSPKPSPKPESSPSPRVVYVTPAPHRPAAAPNSVFTPSAATPAVAAAATPAPNYVPSGPDQAVAIVRSYLGAIARGDRATATTYLAHGLPSEGFMDANSRIVSIRPEAAGNQYKVTADVQTTTGEYYITFTLQQGTGGLQITDHYAIKPQ